MADRPLRILIVEDDPDVLDALRVALADAGYEVLVARDGAEGLMRVERDAPDLLLLDVVMPKRSGFYVLDRLRRGALRRAMRIILTTANDRPEFRDFAASHDVDAFLAKPFDMEEMLATVERVLGGGGRQ
ncbi:MAG: response regulator [Planctomycetales bacterium]